MYILQKKNKEKHRWSFGKSSTRNTNFESLTPSECLPPRRDELPSVTPTILHEEAKQESVVPEPISTSEEARDVIVAEDASNADPHPKDMEKEVNKRDDHFSVMEMDLEEKSAILIQTAFRGYLVGLWSPFAYL